jgi:hypothetical protein
VAVSSFLIKRQRAITATELLGGPSRFNAALLITSAAAVQVNVRRIRKGGQPPWASNNVFVAPLRRG